MQQHCIACIPQVQGVRDDPAVPGGGGAEEGSEDHGLLHTGNGRVSPRGAGQARLQGAHGTLHGRQVRGRRPAWYSSTGIPATDCDHADSLTTGVSVCVGVGVGGGACVRVCVCVCVCVCASCVLSVRALTTIDVRN